MTEKVTLWARVSRVSQRYGRIGFFFKASCLDLSKVSETPHEESSLDAWLVLLTLMRVAIVRTAMVCAGWILEILRLPY